MTPQAATTTRSLTTRCSSPENRCEARGGAVNHHVAGAGLLSKLTSVASSSSHRKSSPVAVSIHPAPQLSATGMPTGDSVPRTMHSV